MAMVALAAIGAAVMAADDPYGGPQTEDSVPPPAHSVWINPRGEFEVWDYDDRNLSDEEKAQDPIVNPRWAPFAECMAERDQDVVDGSPASMRQADLDALVDRLNSEHSDTEANRRISVAEDTSGLAADFLACADEWLNLSSEDLEEKLR
jgi:hypothetical protein